MVRYFASTAQSKPWRWLYFIVIRRLIRFLVIAASMSIGGLGARAQAGSLSLSLNSNAAAGTVSLNVVVATDPGAAPAAIQWTLDYPDADVVGYTAVAGPAATTANKTLTCLGKRCMLWGINGLPIENGVVAVMTLQLASSQSSEVVFELTDVLAASSTADPILGSPVNGSLPVNPQPFVFPPAISASLGFTGSVAQVASAGTWETTMNLINTGGGTANTRTQFFADSGNMLNTVLNLPQSSTPRVWIGASSVDQTLAPGATFVIDSAGLDSQPTQIGSVQLSTAGNVGAFVRLHYIPTDQEAAVPLETRAASSYMLAFDNTNGIATGVAIANLASVPQSIPVVIRDNTGALSGTTSISLPANGHSAFVLTDQLAITIGQSGTIEFDAPQGGQISVMGIRFPPSGSFTAIPVIASSDPGGGSFAHIAAGSGWTSTVELINSGATPAQAHLRFFGDDGSPLPLAYTVAGVATTASAVDQTLPPYARLVIQSNGLNSDPLQMGAAQLSSDGNVSGFSRLRYEPSQQEAIVPAEWRQASAYVLAFDNSNGLATGVAVANTAGNAVSIAVLIRDSTGAQIGSRSITLPANGHSAFALADRFPETLNLSGTIEFNTASAGQISVLGMRSPASGKFSSIPVVVP